MNAPLRPDPPPDGWQLKPEAQLGPYKILEPLAAGGMGEVYKATHTFMSRRTAAIKVLQLSRAEKADFQDRFMEEIALLSELEHPNVVRLYDAGVTERGLVWMAMEFLEGKPLDDLLYDQGQLSVADGLAILADIADGIQAAHAMGVIHRDLKPANIFVTSQNVVKALDFGTSKLLDRKIPRMRLVRSTEKTRVLGTWAYMSPEHLLGNPAPDYRTDIFSLGVIGYELFSGIHPFADPDGLLPSRELVGNRIILAEPRPLPARLPGFDREVWRLIQTAMTKDREKRFRSMEEFAEQLRRAPGFPATGRVSLFPGSTSRPSLSSAAETLSATPVGAAAAAAAGAPAADAPAAGMAGAPAAGATTALSSPPAATLSSPPSPGSASVMPIAKAEGGPPHDRGAFPLSAASGGGSPHGPGAATLSPAAKAPRRLITEPLGVPLTPPPHATGTGAVPSAPSVSSMASAFPPPTARSPKTEPLGAPLPAPATTRVAELTPPPQRSPAQVRPGPRRPVMVTERLEPLSQAFTGAGGDARGSAQNDEAVQRRGQPARTQGPREGWRRRGARRANQMLFVTGRIVELLRQLFGKPASRRIHRDVDVLEKRAAAPKPAAGELSPFTRIAIVIGTALFISGMGLLILQSLLPSDWIGASPAEVLPETPSTAAPLAPPASPPKEPTAAEPAAEPAAPSMQVGDPPSPSFSPPTPRNPPYSPATTISPLLKAPAPNQWQHAEKKKPAPIEEPQNKSLGTQPRLY